MNEEQARQLDRIESKVDSLNILVRGDDHDPAAGVIVRLDRVEQSQRFQSRLMWLAMTGAMRSLWNWFVGGGGHA